jgi:anti-anti-sigma regulatory factor
VGIRIVRRQGRTVLVVSGAIDTYNVDVFEKALGKATENGGQYLIADISSVTYACARVFGLLSAAGARLAARGGSLTVVCPDKSFLCRVFGLLRYPYAVMGTVEEALGKHPGQTF